MIATRERERNQDQGRPEAACANLPEARRLLDRALGLAPAHPGLGAVSAQVDKALSAWCADAVQR